MDKSGLIKASELAQALKELELGIDEKEIQDIIKEIDYVGNNLINYTEFLAASLSVSNTLTEEMLWSMFKKFDVDNTNNITVDNLKEAFKRMGSVNVSDQVLDDIMKKHDKDKSGKLDFEEFK